MPHSVAMMIVLRSWLLTTKLWMLCLMVTHLSVPPISSLCGASTLATHKKLIGSRLPVAQLRSCLTVNTFLKRFFSAWTRITLVIFSSPVKRFLSLLSLVFKVQLLSWISLVSMDRTKVILLSLLIWTKKNLLLIGTHTLVILQLRKVAQSLDMKQKTLLAPIVMLLARHLL